MAVCQDWPDAVTLSGRTLRGPKGDAQLLGRYVQVAEIIIQRPVTSDQIARQLNAPRHSINRALKRLAEIAESVGASVTTFKIDSRAPSYWLRHPEWRAG